MKLIDLRNAVNGIEFDNEKQERMEQMPKEEIETIGEQMQSQLAEADSSTRAYTESEKERRGKLYAQYLEGLFPKDELIQVNSGEEAGKHEFCFLTTTSVFYLPMNRELTDEEILEQIDFEKKRDYALQEQAQAFLEEKLEIRETYKEVKSYYRVNVTDQRVSSLIDVLFVKEDGVSYLTQCRWDGEVRDFSVTTKADYKEHLQIQIEANMEYYKREEGKEVEIEIVEE